MWPHTHTHTHTHTRAHMPQCTCGGQRNICRGQFSPTMQVLRTNSGHWASNRFFYLLKPFGQPPFIRFLITPAKPFSQKDWLWVPGTLHLGGSYLASLAYPSLHSKLSQGYGDLTAQAEPRPPLRGARPELSGRSLLVSASGLGPSSATVSHIQVTHGDS